MFIILKALERLNGKRAAWQIKHARKQGTTRDCQPLKPTGERGMAVDSRGRKYQLRSDGWRRIK